MTFQPAGFSYLDMPKKSLPQSLIFMPELDGFRGVAVATIILFHLKILEYMFGWASLILFFVLSGFLITRILLDSKEKSTHYFRNFYIRRILRTFPIYYIFLFVTVVIGIIFNFKINDLPYYLFYGQNYNFLAKGFHQDFPRMMHHTWSLAVEEQFYLVWPLLVYLLSKKRLLYVSLGLAIIALLTRISSSYYTASGSLAFVTLPTLADTLSMGCVLAIMTKISIKPKSLSISGKYLLLIFVPATVGWLIIFGYDPSQHSDNYLLGHYAKAFFVTICSIIFAAAIAYSVFDDNLFSKIMRWKPLQHLGKISYGLYIYHLMFVCYLPSILKNIGIYSRPLYVVSSLTLTYLVALCSWHFLEKRFLSLKDKFAPVE